MIHITEYQFTEDHLADILADCVHRPSPLPNVFDRTIFWKEIFESYGITLDHLDEVFDAIDRTFKKDI